MAASKAVATGQQPQIRVLQSLFRQTDNDNPYVKQVVAAVSPHAEVAFFSWRTALFGRYDVFHVHWPEFLLRAEGRSRAVRYALFLALLARTAVLRRPVVRTLHNLAPHESAGAAERFLLRLLDSRTQMWIRINAVTEPRAPQTVTILHGHYRDWFADKAVPTSVPGRLLYFGLIRPYKGVETLLECFRQLPAGSCDFSLRLVGNPSTAELRGQIEAAGALDPRVTSLLAYVDDVTLAKEIGEAELVVLPFRQMHNSGSLLLALSLNRPVLVPRNEANEALAAEVGPGWVYMYDGELEPAKLEAALTQLRSDTRAPMPDFSRREWADAGDQHYRAYLSAIRGRPLEAP